MEFSRSEYWVGSCSLLQGIFPSQGLNSGLYTAGGFFISWVTREAPLSPRVCTNLCPLRWVMLSNYLILCHPLLLWPSVFHSIRVFFNESALCISWPKYWSFSFSNSPSSEHSGLISFRIDWLELLAVGKSSPTPQFENITYSVLSLFYGPVLISIHDCWRNHSFDHEDFCQQSDVSAF